MVGLFHYAMLIHYVFDCCQGSVAIFVPWGEPGEFE